LNRASADTHAEARADAVASGPRRFPNGGRHPRPVSANRFPVELHGPKGERLDQQGIEVPDASISAHMTITAYLHHLKNHFGPARGGR
jgi:hypothetical protein